MKINIQSNNNLTQVTDLETGKLISNISKLTWEASANESLTKCTLEMLCLVPAQININTEASLKFIFDPSTYNQETLGNMICQMAEEIYYLKRELNK